MNPPLRYGFRVVGDPTKRRRLIDAAGAFAGYASCSALAEIDRESYLSAFCYGDDFRALLRTTGSTRGFAGACWSPFIWFDIDNEANPEQALTDARRLVLLILERHRTFDDDALLIFFSGRRGYHVGLPTVWGPVPSGSFHLVARRFANRLATEAGVAIDAGIYDRVRCFRAPNSRHPRTGLHKRRFTLDELLNLSADRIREMARQPQAFDVPTINTDLRAAVQDWTECVREVEQESAARKQRRVTFAAGSPTLNRQTLAFIRDGAEEGSRHRLLFSAAANLAEFGCPPALAHALLAEAALDSGLSPREVHRQIECGLQHGTGSTEGNGRA